MTLLEAISVRRTIRSYRMEEPVPTELQDELVDFLSDLEVPNGGIDWNFDLLPFSEMCQVVGGTPTMQSPHYLILRSEKQNGCLQNSGFVGECAAVWLASRGIASCWQSAIDLENDFDDVLPFIAAVGFGYSDEPFRSEPRKTGKLEKTAIGKLDGYRERMVFAMDQAPSFRDTFPVRIYAEQYRMHFFRTKPRIQLPQLSYMACLDVGVAAAHLSIAAQAEGYSIRFEKQQPEPVYKKHHKYQFTALLTSHT